MAWKAKIITKTLADLRGKTNVRHNAGTRDKQNDTVFKEHYDKHLKDNEDQVKVGWNRS